LLSIERNKAIRSADAVARPLAAETGRPWTTNLGADDQPPDPEEDDDDPEDDDPDEDEVDEVDEVPNDAEIAAPTDLSALTCASRFANCVNKACCCCCNAVLDSVICVWKSVIC
jgi:hypothetical protein